MKKKPTRIISRILSFTLAFMMMFSSFTSVFAVDTGRTPGSIPNRTYIIGTHEFTSEMALTTSRIMIAARTIQGDNLTEEDMVIYYKNPYGNWINATNGKPIPQNKLPQSFTITHTDLEGEVVVDKTVLENFISTANNNLVSTFISTDGSDVDPLAKWVTQAVMDAYTDAIEAAQTVADKEDATLSEVDAALLALSQAMLKFDSAKKDGIVIVSAISVTGTGGVTTITTKGGTLQMVATVTPSNASNKAVTWTVTETDGTATDKATISNTGLLTAVKNGTVKVTATAKDGSGKSGSANIEISNQVTPPETFKVTLAGDAVKDTDYTISGASDLDAVVDGTELTITATNAIVVNSENVEAGGEKKITITAATTLTINKSEGD